EGPLDTDPEGHLADGEGLTHAGALAADHDALEHLDTAAVPLDDVHADLEGVTGAELRDLSQGGGVDGVQLLHDVPSHGCHRSPAMIRAVLRTAEGLSVLLRARSCRSPVAETAGAPDDRPSLPQRTDRPKSPSLQRAVHHVVALAPAADGERAVADPGEPVLGVETLRALVAPVDAEPDAGQAALARGVQGRRHEGRGDTAAVVLGQHVALAELGGGPVRDG